MGDSDLHYHRVMYYHFCVTRLNSWQLFEGLTMAQRRLLTPVASKLVLTRWFLSISTSLWDCWVSLVIAVASPRSISNSWCQGILSSSFWEVRQQSKEDFALSVHCSHSAFHPFKALMKGTLFGMIISHEHPSPSFSYFVSQHL